MCVIAYVCVYTYVFVCVCVHMYIYVTAYCMCTIILCTYVCMFTSPCNEAYEFKRVRRFREREREKMKNITFYI